MKWKLRYLLNLSLISIEQFSHVHTESGHRVVIHDWFYTNQSAGGVPVALSSRIRSYGSHRFVHFVLNRSIMFTTSVTFILRTERFRAIQWANQNNGMNSNHLYRIIFTPADFFLRLFHILLKMKEKYIL